MTDNQVVVFKKFLREVGVLGQGATGDTRLFEDVNTGWKYAIKKFSPYYEEQKDDHFIRFINEIKILSEILHPNIVRLYDFYLFPDAKQGFIRMEFVEGCSIDEFDVQKSGRSWDNIFIDLIDAFNYLEESGILHRDIKFDNILINSRGVPKIIDFGFGKINFQESGKTSVIMQTPFLEDPEEVVTRNTYNHSSEIFYLGKMFKELGLIDNPSFTHKKTLEKMQQYYESQRYKSFKDVKDAINLKFIDMNFSREQKEKYLSFADSISKILVSHEDAIQLFDNYEIVVKNLNELIRKSILEDFLQKSSDLLNCFIDNDFTFKSTEVSMDVIRNFYDLLVSEDNYKRNIIIDNINTRIRSKPINFSLPF